MRVLLTGSQGFTGQHFVAAARLAGWEMVALQADLTEPEAVTAEVLRVAPDYVVHLAAISFVAHHDQLALYGVNVFGTLNLLEALARLPVSPRRVLIASSANVYGNALVSPISEDMPPAPVNHYAASKLVMEHLARTYSDRLRIMIVRPFNYTGVGHSLDFLIPKLVDHFAKRAAQIELGNLSVEREFNDVRMVVDAYMRLLNAPADNEIINVCSGKPVALREVLQVLSSLTGHSIEVIVNPAFVRKNEVHRLCGQNRKLVSTIGELKSFRLEDTLAWMIAAARPE